MLPPTNIGTDSLENLVQLNRKKIQIFLQFIIHFSPFPKYAFGHEEVATDCVSDSDKSNGYANVMTLALKHYCHGAVYD